MWQATLLQVLVAASQPAPARSNEAVVPDQVTLAGQGSVGPAPVIQAGRVGAAGAAGSQGWTGRVLRGSNTTSRCPFTWRRGSTLPAPVGAPAGPWQAPHCRAACQPLATR